MENVNHISEELYNLAQNKVEELLPLVTNETPANDPNSIELMHWSEIVEQYELAHYPIKKPSIAELISNAIEEFGLTQRDLAKMINISPSRINDYVKGKAEPTLYIAGKLCRVLKIEPADMLMV
ncbi:MAG: helix-turn-helix domain-containing protein [Bacteroidales bacterium]|nr:helix-turn-helix domain-containing protein [Bacteroidales bacterium]